jgi:hypothetical protein
MSGTNETLTMLRDLLSKSTSPEDLAKASTFVQNATATQGLQGYDLEPAAKNLYPILTPLRNRIPRVGGGFGSQANWKAVTGVDTTLQYAGVSEGRRGQMIQVGTKEYFAAYRTLGLESAASYEATLAGQGFDDIKARAVHSLLQATMVAEEKIILGGNTSVSLGTTPTPTLSATTTGGTIAASTAVYVGCVALSYEAWSRFTVAGGLQATITITPTDGQGTITAGGGVAQKSAVANVTTGAGTSTNSVTASVTPIRGAYAYAWFVGASGSQTLAAITTVARYTVTSLTTLGTQTIASLPSADNSTSSLVHDGLLGIIGNSAMGSYYYAAANGAGLTGDGAMGIVEFDVALQWYWDNYRMSPSRIVLSSQETLTIRKKILASGGSSASVRFTFDIQNGQVVGGNKPRGYLNPFAMSGGPAEIPFELHPNLPPAR